MGVFLEAGMPYHPALHPAPVATSPHYIPACWWDRRDSNPRACYRSGLQPDAVAAAPQSHVGFEPLRGRPRVLPLAILPHAATRAQYLAGRCQRRDSGRARRPALACSAAGHGCGGFAGAGRWRRAFSPSGPFGLPRARSRASSGKSLQSVGEFLRYPGHLLGGRRRGRP